MVRILVLIELVGATRREVLRLGGSGVSEGRSRSCLMARRHRDQFTAWSRRAGIADFVTWNNADWDMQRHYHRRRCRPGVERNMHRGCRTAHRRHARLRVRRQRGPNSLLATIGHNVTRASEPPQSAAFPTSGPGWRAWSIGEATRFPDKSFSCGSCPPSPTPSACTRAGSVASTDPLSASGRAPSPGGTGGSRIAIDDQLYLPVPSSPTTASPPPTCRDRHHGGCGGGAC